MSATSIGYADIAGRFWQSRDGRLWSAAVDSLVPVPSLPQGVTALAWPADASGNQTPAALYALLSPYGLGAALGPAPTQAQLVEYANAKQIALRDGGITVNVGTSSTPDEVNVASDVNGRSLVSGCVQLIGLAAQNSQPAPTFPWINNGGTQLALTGAQMMTIGYALGAFIQATYASNGTCLAGIASGSLTTAAAIDAAAWPATAY